MVSGEPGLSVTPDWMQDEERHETRHEQQDGTQDEQLKRKTVHAMLGQVIDPEVGLDILTMGLIYHVRLPHPNVIFVEMTLTTKGCPLGSYLTDSAEHAVRQAYPDDDIHVLLVWDPPWTPAMIDRDALIRAQSNQG